MSTIDSLSRIFLISSVVVSSPSPIMQTSIGVFLRISLGLMVEWAPPATISISKPKPLTLAKVSKARSLLGVVNEIA